MPVVVMYMSSALPCSTTLVSPPTIGNAGLLSGVGHRANFRFEHRSRQTRLKNEA